MKVLFIDNLNMFIFLKTNELIFNKSNSKSVSLKKTINRINKYFSFELLHENYHSKIRVHFKFLAFYCYIFTG